MACEYSFRIVCDMKNIDTFKDIASEMISKTNPIEQSKEDAIYQLENYMSYEDRYYEFRLYFPGPKLCFSLNPILLSAFGLVSGMKFPVEILILQNGGSRKICKDIEKIVIDIIKARELELSGVLKYD